MKYSKLFPLKVFLFALKQPILMQFNYKSLTSQRAYDVETTMMQSLYVALTLIGRYVSALMSSLQIVGTRTATCTVIALVNFFLVVFFVVVFY